MSSVGLRSWKLQEFTAHESNVSCLALGPMSGRVLVTGGYDRKVNLWALGTATPLLSLNAHQSTVECVKFGHTEELVCSGSHAGELNIWDLEANKKVRSFAGHRDGVKSLDFHPYGDFLASGSLDTSIKLWDLRRKGCLSSYKGHTLTVNRVRFSPDGIWLASAGEDGTVMMWDVRVGQRLAELRDHEAAVLSVEFHPHEFLLASAGMDRSVQFCDLETFRMVSSATQDAGPIRCLRFSPDGKCLYGGVDDQLKVFAWEPGRLLDSVNTGWGNIQDIVHTGNQLVGASLNKSMVALMTVDLKTVRTKADPVPAVMSSGSNIASSGLSPRSTHVRKSFSKEKMLPGSFTVKRILDDSERSGGDTEEERSDPTKAFLPHRTLNRTPPPEPPAPAPPLAIETSADRPDPDREEDMTLPNRYETQEPLSLSSLDSIPRSSYEHHTHSPPQSYLPQPKIRSPSDPQRKLSYQPPDQSSSPCFRRRGAHTARSPSPPSPPSRRHGAQTARSPSPRSPSPQQLVSPVPKVRRHSTSEQRRPVLPDKPKLVVATRPQRQTHADAENNYPVKMNNIRHSPSEPMLSKPIGTSQTARLRKGSLNVPDATPLSARGPAVPAGPSVARQQRPERPVLPVRPSPAASPAYFTPPQSLTQPESPLNETVERLGAVNIEDFLPKSADRPYNSQYKASVSESEAFSAIQSVHNSMMAALSSRQRNLQVVFSVWHTKEPRAAVDAAVGMNDPALMADLLGVLVQRPPIWSLDMCGAVLPALEEMLHSKYEAYMTIGCSALSLILRNFAHIIRTNILAPVHTMGVDISREERYNKSMRCYQQLISMRAFLLKRQTVPGKLGQSFRELLMLMDNLEG